MLLCKDVPILILCRFNTIRSIFFSSHINIHELVSFLLARQNLPSTNIISIETPESAFEQRVVSRLVDYCGNDTLATKMAFQMEFVLCTTPGIIMITQGKFSSHVIIVSSSCVHHVIIVSSSCDYRVIIM